MRSDRGGTGKEQKKMLKTKILPTFDNCAVDLIILLFSVLSFASPKKKKKRDALCFDVARIMNAREMCS